jgi:hypothetical protein
MFNRHVITKNFLVQWLYIPHDLLYPVADSVVMMAIIEGIAV